MDGLLEDFLATLDALANVGGPVHLQDLLEVGSREVRAGWRDALLHASPPPKPPRDDAERLAMVMGIDDALGYCVPERQLSPAEIPSGIAALYHTYLTEAWLWRSASGELLVPRRCKYGRPRDQETVEDLCSNVVRVPAHVAARIRFEWVFPGCDHAGDTGLDLRVAAAPFMGPGDVRIEPVQRGGAYYYRLAPRRQRLAPVVERVVEQLAGEPSDVCLVPEGCLDPDLLDVWVRVLAAGPAGDLPTWVLPGSGPFPVAADPGSPPANRAVLLHAATGTVLLEHDKRLPFKLTASQVADWNLADPVPAHDHPGLGPETRGEFITTGTGPVTVLESRAGRFAILVCEDMARSTTPLTTDLVAVGVSHLLVPIFSKEILEWHWEQQAAVHYALEAGTRVAVANSLVVPHFDGVTAAGAVGCLLVMAPDAGDEWPQADILSATVPDEVVTATLPGL